MIIGRLVFSIGGAVMLAIAAALRNPTCQTRSRRAD
jgi:hypothetical protein